MIHLVITAANINEAYEKRKQQYIESIEACLNYRHLFDSYTVLECASEHETYLDAYNTFYSKQKNSFLNKGLNEMTHLQAYLQQTSLADDTAIIKLTGRYIVEDGYFFEKVAELHQKFDSIFKNDNDVFEGNGYHTFFYYMNKKLFLDVANDLNYSDDNNTPIEWDIKDYLLGNSKHIETDRLGVLAQQGTNSEKIFRA
jgi:hypothetical protein